jgi:hypothetical protein
MLGYCYDQGFGITRSRQKVLPDVVSELFLV